MQRGEDADAKYELLVQAAPRDFNAIQRSATSKQQLGRLPEAIDRWRQIARGVPAGEEAWLQAKYQLIVCLQQLDDPSAVSLLQQTVNLVPNMSDEWSQRFAELARRLPSPMEQR